MTFQDIKFPDEISFGSKGGPEFDTTVLELSSGVEKFNTNWQRPRAKYDVSHGIKSRAEMDVLTAFFYVSFGQAFSFRFKDWADYTVSTTQIGVGDGVEVDFQLIKIYTFTPITYTRLITKPVVGTLLGVTVNAVSQTEGVDYTVDYITGIVTFTVAPPAAELVVFDSLEFDVHCRFATDHLNITHDFWETMSWDPIPIWEIKDTAS